jgi:DNA oxidative demethylase
LQRSLLEPDLPHGFHYRPAFVSLPEQHALLDRIAGIEFSAVEMRGVVARRRTAHYGWTYGYEKRTGAPGVAIPEFLLPLRARVAQWLGTEPERLAEALVTEYPPAAAIGWHRDAPIFGDVAGISLGCSSRMKFRPYVAPKDARSANIPRRTTHELELVPGSGYLITGVARKAFEHSIPPVEGTRYSITFRTLADRTGPRR